MRLLFNAQAIGRDEGEEKRRGGLYQDWSQVHPLVPLVHVTNVTCSDKWDTLTLYRENLCKWLKGHVLKWNKICKSCSGKTEKPIKPPKVNWILIPYLEIKMENHCNAMQFGKLLVSKAEAMLSGSFDHEENWKHHPNNPRPATQISKWGNGQEVQIVNGWLTISPSRTTFSPLTTKMPRGMSPYFLPTWMRSTVWCNTRFAAGFRKWRK